MALEGVCLLLHNAILCSELFLFVLVEYAVFFASHNSETSAFSLGLLAMCPLFLPIIVVFYFFFQFFLLSLQRYCITLYATRVYGGVRAVICM